jgi:poly(3-hydroxyalkanoate) synthetase
MERTRHWIDNRQGWRLDVKEYVEPRKVDPALPPILIIPGYCMNTFILAFHPRGTSLVEHLARRGFVVFTANLRAQGESERAGGTMRIGFRELALVDLPRVIEFVLERRRSERLHLIGCSLGGSFAYAYVAHHPKAHHLASLTGMGAPLRWERKHPLLSLMFSSVRLASVLEIRGTRRLARAALPVAKRIPKALDLYMNAAGIDLSKADRLVETVDDPIAHLNVQIVRWIERGDLVVAGKSVAEGLGHANVPLLNIFANADGIVPPATARSVARWMGSSVEHLEVGDDASWFAHADMFINDEAERRVFEPLSRWLLARE